MKYLFSIQSFLVTFFLWIILFVSIGHFESKDAVYYQSDSPSGQNMVYGEPGDNGFPEIQWKDKSKSEASWSSGHILKTKNPVYTSYRVIPRYFQIRFPRKKKSEVKITKCFIHFLSKERTSWNLLEKEYRCTGSSINGQSSGVHYEWTFLDLIEFPPTTAEVIWEGYDSEKKEWIKYKNDFSFSPEDRGKSTDYEFNSMNIADFFIYVPYALKSYIVFMCVLGLWNAVVLTALVMKKFKPTLSQEES